MPAANIQINAVTATQAVVPIGVIVQLSNADIGGEATYAWTILDQPEDNPPVSLSNPAIENPTFTPTREGSYRIKLVVDATLPTEVVAYAVIGVAQVRSNRVLPSAGEILERDAARGWATEILRIHQDVDRLTGDANVVVATATSGMAVGQMVRIAGIDTIKTGLPGQETVMQAVPAFADNPVKVRGSLGQVIAVCDGGSIAVGKLVRVRMSGLSPFTVTPPGPVPTVGDWVTVDNLAMPSTSFLAPDYPRIIGKVVSVSGGLYRWVIDNAYADAVKVRTVAPSAAALWNGTGTWVQTGDGSSVAGWSATTATASGLHYPLPVAPHESIFKIMGEALLGSATGLITARLLIGKPPDGALLSNFDTSPGSLGYSTWDVKVLGAITLPASVGEGETAELEVCTSGGGAAARTVGSFFVYTYPTP